MVRVKNSSQKSLIDEVLTRGVEQVIVRHTLEQKLQSGDKIRLYLGIDPTSSKLHLGNSIQLRKLRDFVHLGHEVIFLVGTFTALIGDTSDKTAMRQPMTLEEVNANFVTYQEQASKILDFSKVKVVYNGEWLSKLQFEDIVRLAQQFTVQQMIERDMYQKRIESGKPIGLHEFLYPLMQGYDSVAMDVDLEVGGNDQTFNMLAGRTLQRVYNHKEKHVLSTKMLVGTDGRKMSKSYGNVVSITDVPADMFGKMMGVADAEIINYFICCTDVALKDIEEYRKAMESGENPKNFKVMLAREIVSLYHGQKEADQASENFEEVFSKGGRPDNVELKEFDCGKFKVTALICELDLAPSRTEARRLIEQGGVRVDDVKIEGVDDILTLKEGQKVLLQVGKRKWIELMGKEAVEE